MIQYLPWEYRGNIGTRQDDAADIYVLLPVAASCLILGPFSINVIDFIMPLLNADGKTNQKGL